MTSYAEALAEAGRLREALVQIEKLLSRALAEPASSYDSQIMVMACAEAETALAAKPAQSLAEVKAALLREVAKRFAYRRNDGDWTIHPDSLTDEADRIEKEAANG